MRLEKPYKEQDYYDFIAWCNQNNSVPKEYDDYFESEEYVTPQNVLLEQQIQSLKSKLSLTDYKCLKYVDGSLSEEEYLPIKQERQELRNQINLLEEQLALL